MHHGQPLSSADLWLDYAFLAETFFMLLSGSVQGMGVTFAPNHWFLPKTSICLLPSFQKTPPSNQSSKMKLGFFFP